MRELELCHMSVISLSSPVVSLLLFEMIGFSFEPLHKEKRATRVLGSFILDDKSGHVTVIL